jgi:hypothetical protein
MRKRRQVRFRSNSAVARGLDISPEIAGSVMCRYRIIREGASAPNRLDVCFGRRVAWGVIEQEFETIPFSSTHKGLKQERERTSRNDPA